MLTSIGLILNFVGSIVLLGSDVKIIERMVERIDLIHYAYMNGFHRLMSESMVEERENDNRVYPFDKTVSADQWSLWPIRHFLQRHSEQEIPSEAEIDIRGGWFKVNGEQLTLPEERTVQLNEKERLRTNRTLSLGAVPGLIYEARMRRVYIYGVCLIALGFLCQLIDSLGIF